MLNRVYRVSVYTYQEHSEFALQPYKHSSGLFVNSKSTVIELVHLPDTKHCAGAYDYRKKVIPTCSWRFLNPNYLFQSISLLDIMGTS